jgi:hypothetical protein
MISKKKPKEFEIPYGRPVKIYFVPGIFGGHNFGHRVDQDDIQICQNFMDHLNGFIVTKPITCLRGIVVKQKASDSY